jgi:hypothetical protein
MDPAETAAIAGKAPAVAGSEPRIKLHIDIEMGFH